MSARETLLAGPGFAATALLMCSCVDSDTVVCSWGLRCPAGTVCSETYRACVGPVGKQCSFGECEPGQYCDEAHRQCIYPIQHDVCAELGELDPCAFPGATGDYRCLEGVCLRPACGDGVREETERCDDGNPNPGDGCSAGCRIEPGWECQGEPSACIPSPLERGPGERLTVQGASATFADLYRTGSGVLLVTSRGAPGAMAQRLSRSENGGTTWESVELGSTGQDTSSGWVFAVDDGTIAVSSNQGNSTPYDGFIRYTENEGVSFPGNWINVTQSGDLPLGKTAPWVIATPGSRYLAIFRYRYDVYSRLADTLGSWSQTTRTLLLQNSSLWYISLTRFDDDILLVASASNQTIETHTSEDDGESFELTSVTPTTEQLFTVKLHRRPGSDVLYLCGVTGHDNGTDDRVYVLRSFDSGQTWIDETIYVQGLDRATAGGFSCHLDETGVYVGYQDRDTEKVTLILPGDPVACGNGKLDPGEQCDGDVFVGGASCVRYGFGGGSLRCAEDCLLIETDGCTPASLPTSCVHIDWPADRHYFIDSDGDGPNPPFEVYCADMDTPNPQAYLTLVETGPESNYSTYRYTSFDTEATCRYRRVRFADVYELRLDGTDQRFATCYGNGDYFHGADWGYASSCMPSEPGTMNIDLTSTPFRIDTEGGAGWEVSGWVPQGRVTRNDGPGIVVEAEGSGYCGGMVPKNPPGLILAFQ